MIKVLMSSFMPESFQCLAHSICIWILVKNGFSDPTKEQEGQDRPRKDVMNRCQAKALREGCHERKEAQMGVSSREKMNTNKNLARATTKSKSEMQTVSNGHVS